MIRPGIGLLLVLLGFVALPGVAMAQDPVPDTTQPTVTIATPLEGAEYTKGQPLTASFACNDAGGIESCVGSTANGATIDTQTVGDFVFTVTAKDVAGNTRVETRNYKVKPVEGDVGGGAPATLTLTLGQPTSFAPFTPGVGRDYTATLVATILSTAADASLSVADASSTSTGHLVNGAFALEKAVVAGATSTVEYAHSSTPGRIGGSANPTMLLTYDGPVTNDTPTLTFTQGITQTEALRTGPYTKTLTFTLSTTNP